MKKFIAMLMSTLALFSFPSLTASAEELITIGNYQFPVSSVEITEESFEINTGEDITGRAYPSDDALTRTTWGTSYAYSKEYVQLFYQGHAFAAANVYEGKRITQVCFWWTHGSSSSKQHCSTASYVESVGWRPPSRETVALSTDSLNPWAPQTVFHIQTARIPPNLTPAKITPQGKD